MLVNQTHADKKMAKSNRFQFGTSFFRNFTIGIVVTFILLATAFTIATLQYNKRELLSGVRSSLRTVLNTTMESLKIWMADKKLFVEQLGKDDILVQTVQQLLQVDPAPQSLLASQKLHELRYILKTHQISEENTGFSIINKDSICILSLRDENLGTHNSIARERPDLFLRIFKGESVFVPPIRSDISLEKNKATAQQTPTIFFIAPVVDKEQNIIAAVAMHLDPTKNFSRVIQLGRLGKSGETYAFDTQGRLLSESRFVEQLRQIGLINQDQDSILNIRLTDPGVNLLFGNQAPVSQNKRTYTIMAESALRGESGENLEGYRDYRGVTVYGAWRWDDSLGLGLTTEIDAADALSHYLLLRRTVFGILAVVLFSAAAGIIFTVVYGERAYQIMKTTQGNLEEQVSQRTNELQESEKSLRKALEVSEAAKRAKSQFLANMSHEIRTPMNAIIGFTDVILTTSLNEMQRKHLNTVARSAKFLLSLLNDILDISKLEEGKMVLEKVCFMLPNVVEDVLSTLGIKALEKNITLHLQYDEALPNCFVGDPAKLRQVIMNLIGNAIKFTATGSVSLIIKPDLKNDFLHFMIKDTGIGIRADRQEAIFSPFTQADTSTTRKYGGTGLGIAISRQIVEKMSGRIWVESTEGKGSVFHFTVYMPQTECTATCKEGKGEAPVEFRATRSLNILLVEDIPENAELATIRLAAVGHQIAVAVNGFHAVQMATDNKGAFDLILMDIHMPEMDGYEATRQIRKMEAEKGSHVPIIALSASVLREERDMCMKAGMDGFVGKPIDFFELFAEIARVVSKESGKPIDDLQIVTEQIDRGLPQLAGIDLERGIRNWRNTGLYIKSLRSFSRKHRHDGEHIRQAVAKNDIKSAEEITHALKGVAGNLAVLDVSAIAARLNDALKKGEGNYDDLIHALADALEVATKSIKTLNDQADAGRENFQEKQDAQAAQKMFIDLLVALDTDNPDRIDPLLGQLQEVCKDPQVTVIVRQVEDFDFRGAEKGLKILAEKLNIALEGCNG